MSLGGSTEVLPHTHIQKSINSVPYRVTLTSLLPKDTCTVPCFLKKQLLVYLLLNHVALLPKGNGG